MFIMKASVASLSRSKKGFGWQRGESTYTLQGAKVTYIIVC